jgi:DNA-directed RNA polymerase subunit RPC12/RpoP
MLPSLPSSVSLTSNECGRALSAARDVKAGVRCISCGYVVVDFSYFGHCNRYLTRTLLQFHLTCSIQEVIVSEQALLIVPHEESLAGTCSGCFSVSNEAQPISCPECLLVRCEHNSKNYSPLSD